MGEPGTLYAAQAGVTSIDHATQLSDETMRLMREKHIPAVPTFAIFNYFAQHRESQTGAPTDRSSSAGTEDQAAHEAAMLDYKIAEFKKQIAAGVPFAVGSDVGPFPHGTQAVEMELMVRYGMKPLAVLQADMINGAKVLGWENQIGQLKPGYFADIVAVPGNPLDDITARRARKFRHESPAQSCASKRLYPRQPSQQTSPPWELSSRAQPRDLRLLFLTILAHISVRVPQSSRFLRWVGKNRTPSDLFLYPLITNQHQPTARAVGVRRGEFVSPALQRWVGATHRFPGVPQGTALIFNTALAVQNGVHPNSCQADRKKQRP